MLYGFSSKNSGVVENFGLLCLVDLVTVPCIYWILEQLASVQGQKLSNSPFVICSLSSSESPKLYPVVYHIPEHDRVNVFCAQHPSVSRIVFGSGPKYSPGNRDERTDM